MPWTEVGAAAEDSEATTVDKWVATGILIFGVVAMVVATVVSLDEIAEYFAGGAEQRCGQKS